MYYHLKMRDVQCHLGLPKGNLENFRQKMPSTRTCFITSFGVENHLKIQGWLFPKIGILSFLESGGIHLFFRDSGRLYIIIFNQSSYHNTKKGRFSTWMSISTDNRRTHPSHPSFRPFSPPKFWVLELRWRRSPSRSTKRAEKTKQQNCFVDVTEVNFSTAFSFFIGLQDGSIWKMFVIPAS